MAPVCPDEVNVYTVPHSRMKHLIDTYLKMVTSACFRDVQNMTCILENLHHAFNLFKVHEQIENHLIMQRLKDRLLAVDITCDDVYNCHNDDYLAEILILVSDGYCWTQRSELERVKYGGLLEQALEDFIDRFLPHMKEEEEIFQPMLIEHFTYDELKELRVTVIEQHQKEEEELQSDFCDKETCLQELPDELMEIIFKCLSPKDLCRCAQVCRHWNVIALSPHLWPDILPVRWAQGDWINSPCVVTSLEHGCSMIAQGSYHHDTDDADECGVSDLLTGGMEYLKVLREKCVATSLVTYLLPRVGCGVRCVDLAHTCLTDASLVHEMLMLCPDLQTLTLACSDIARSLFQECQPKHGMYHLHHLDLSNCCGITDDALRYLAGVADITSSTECSNVFSDNVDWFGVNTSSSVCGRCPELMSCDISASKSAVPVTGHAISSDSHFCSISSERVGPGSFDAISSSTGGVTSHGLCRVLRHSFCHTAVCRTMGDAVCCFNYGCHGDGSDGGVNHLHGITHLALNSCHRITDDGLSALSSLGGLPHLKFLDLSGCVRVTGTAVSRLVATSSCLDHTFLFYCDLIDTDPFPKSASACRNLDCSNRFCCHARH